MRNIFIVLPNFIFSCLYVLGSAKLHLTVFGRGEVVDFHHKIWFGELQPPIAHMLLWACFIF